MAEKLYFIKTNPVAAKINLYNRLCREEEQVLRFLQDDPKTSLELIKKKVKESNLSDCSPEEMSGIFRWFEATHSPDPEEIKTQLFVHGLDIFYEIPEPGLIEGFLHLLSEYESRTHIRLASATASEHFIPFLIFGIFLSGLRNSTEHYLPGFLQSKHQDLYTLAEKAYQDKQTADPYPSDLYCCFSELYDETKFYKGFIIRLHA